MCMCWCIRCMNLFGSPVKIHRENQFRDCATLYKHVLVDISEVVRLNPKGIHNVLQFELSTTKILRKVIALGCFGVLWLMVPCVDLAKPLEIKQECCLGQGKCVAQPCRVHGRSTARPADPSEVGTLSVPENTLHLPGL